MGKRSKRLWLDRLINGGSMRQISLLIAVSLLVFFIVGGFFVAFFAGNIGHTSEVSPMQHFWQLYYYFADPGNQMSMDGGADGSRFIGFVMSTLGSVFLGGLLISTITNIIERRVESCRNGQAYYKFTDHVVIIGSDQMVKGIIKQVCRSDVRHVVVMTSGNVEQLRTQLEATLPDKKLNNKIVVNYGTRDASLYLEAINVTEAREVYIVGDDSEFDDIENFHDSLNIECLRLIAKLCKEKGRRKLPCNVSFEYKTTYHVFQYADLPKDITDYVDFRPFNFYEFWAQKVLVANESPDHDIKYQPLDYHPILKEDSDSFVHLIIVGMSKMGAAMALQAAHIAHYPNWRRRKTRITIIDRNMRREMDVFKQTCGELFALSRSEYIDADRWVETGEFCKETYGIDKEKYGHLIYDEADPDFIDIEWCFIKGDDCNPRVRELLEGYAKEEGALVTVAICLNITHVSLRSAMHLPGIYYEKQIPVLLQQRKTETLVDTINGRNMPEDERARLLYRNIQPFGMVYDCYDIRFSSLLDFCKRINSCYNFYFAYGMNPVQIDQVTAEKEWDKVQMSKRWSNIFAAASIPTKLRCIGYNVVDVRSGKHIDEITDEQVRMLSEMEHNRWNVEELLLGYRPVTKTEDEEIDAVRELKNSYKKRYIHYDIRPYGGLKEDEKHRKASLYDEMIVRCIPVIVNPK